MKKTILGLMSLLFVLLIFEVANAQFIDVFDSIGYKYMNQNSGYVVGQFDISSYLPQDGSYSTPYQINSAKVVLTFQDIPEWSYSETYRVHNLLSYTNSSGRYIEIHDNFIYTHYFSERELAYLQVQWELDPVLNVLAYSSNQVFTGLTETIIEYNDQNKTVFVNDYNYKVYDGFSGPFTVEQSLGEWAISKLSETGMIGFSTWAYVGEMVLLEGVLTIDIANTTPVPEPSTLLLLGGGLTGLAWYGRKQKRS